MRSANDSSRGVALFEIALTLPVLLLLIAGIVNWWQLVWRQDLILTASRHGARAAAARARQLSLDGQTEDACGDASGTSPALTTAVGLTYRYLVDAGLETGACAPAGSPVRACAGPTYTVSADFQTVCEAGLGHRGIRVRVSSNGTVPCLFCFRQILEGVAINGESLFAAEAACRTLPGVVTCP